MLLETIPNLRVVYLFILGVNGNQTTSVRQTSRLEPVKTTNLSSFWNLDLVPTKKKKIFSVKYLHELWML